MEYVFHDDDDVDDDNNNNNGMHRTAIVFNSFTRDTASSHPSHSLSLLLLLIPLSIITIISRTNTSHNVTSRCSTQRTTRNNITQENFNILVITAYKTGLPLIYI
jgi:hypothetical protein